MTPRPAPEGRWWSYLDNPPRWVVECPTDGRDVVDRPEPSPCPAGCLPLRRVVGRWLPDAPPVLLRGTTVCAACGNDLLTERGLLARCRDSHKVKRGAA